MGLGGPGADRDVLAAPPYWGAITATIDWCEQNYVVFYIAEFWNSVTNGGMFLLTLYGMYQTYKIGDMPMRYYISWLGLLLISIGSFCFHGTLRYDMQLLDELPMVYSAAVVIYCLFEDEPKDKHKHWLPLFLVLVCAGVTFVYVMIFKNPLLHEGIYGCMVIVMVSKAYKLAMSYARETNDPLFLRMFLTSSSSFFLAWVLWNIDNQFCTELRDMRGRIGPFAPLLELHGWWHVLTGYSSYILVLFTVIARQRIIGVDARFAFGNSVVPYIIRNVSAGKRH